MTIHRLYIFCEGQTEESFANSALYHHFFRRSGTFTIPIILPHKKGLTSRLHKGGWIDYTRAKTFIQNFMAANSNEHVWFSTMLDLYAIPDNFPNLETVPRADPHNRVVQLETSFGVDIRTDALWRFTPYLQLHEFEALLLADPNEIKSSFPERVDAIDALIADLGGAAPELIDDGRETAPSKRIIKRVPEYEGRKASAGPIIAGKIGIPTLRERCPHFNNWLSELEARTGL